MLERAWHAATAAGVVCAMAIATPAWGQANALKDLAAAAAKKPPVIVYESSAPEQMLKVIAAFNKTYPDIKAQHVRITGGAGVAAKVIQEAEAGANTASLIIADAQQVIPLQQRNLLVSRDWKALGVPAELIKTPYAVLEAATLSVLIWNKTNVKEAELPTTWEALVSDKWKGRLATWARGAQMAPLAKSMGEKGMHDWVQKTVDLKPLTYASGFQLAQQVAAGEADIAMGLYHTSLPVIKTGAPLGLRFLDPVTVSPIYGSVVAKGANPEGAQVLAAWLTTAEGARAYEEATGRGNPLVKATDTAQQLGSHKMVEFGFDEAATLERLDAEYSKMLSTAGKPK